ncbi:hypothetical protein JTE90_014525 [Oedothorax gibbosus]|uniref:Uncharacterized protein n=1 Tax=Oedothorax gibbosus TaxID=931172 RepID=A0AAV6UZL6_9ARAC|nr:hypothetical protein JTE90_014525 [Oedothorax gibbosus]
MLPISKWQPRSKGRRTRQCRPRNSSGIVEDRSKYPTRKGYLVLDIRKEDFEFRIFRHTHKRGLAIGDYVPYPLQLCVSLGSVEY